MRFLGLVAVAAWGLIACGGSSDGDGGSGGAGAGGDGGGGGAPDPDPQGCQPPDAAEGFEVGTGELCFAEVNDGGVIQQMHGPQGGYHVWLALGCIDCGDQVWVRGSVLDPATGSPLPNTYTTDNIVTLSKGAWPQIAGIQQGMPGDDFLDEPGYEPLPPGTPFILRAQVFALDGATLLHEAEVSAVLGDTVDWDPCDADPTGPCCSPDDMCLGNDG